MKITLFFTYNVSLSDWKNAGILSRELEIYKYIYKKYNIRFNLVTYGDKQDLELLDLDGIEIFPVYTRVKFSDKKFINIFKSFTIPFIFRDIIKDSDILKTNQLKGSWVPIISKIIYRKPLIIRTGYDLLRWSAYENKNIWNRSFVFLLTKISLIFSNQYNVSSMSDKLFLEKRFGKKNKIKLRPNFVDTNKFFNTNFERKEEILFVGRLEYQKNLDFLIDEYKNFELPRLNVIGTGTYSDRLQNEINQNNLNINYIGHVPNEELSKYYNKFKFFILCSHYEGNPKALIESMACGSIVIGNDIDGINNIISDNLNGFLINCEQGDLKKIFDNFKLQKNNLVDVQSNAISFVRKNHTLENLANLELSDYTKL